MARSDQVRVYKNQNQMDIALFLVTEKAVLNMAYSVAIGSANTFSLILDFHTQLQEHGQSETFSSKDSLPSCVA